MVTDLNEFKNKEINNIFVKIGPILEKYMKDGSIIILNSKILLLLIQIRYHKNNYW